MFAIRPLVFPLHELIMFLLPLLLLSLVPTTLSLNPGRLNRQFASNHYRGIVPSQSTISSRSFTTRWVGSPSASDAVDPLLEWTRKKIKAIEYCLKNSTIPPPPEIVDFLPIYGGWDEDRLSSTLQWLYSYLDKHREGKELLLECEVPIGSEGK
jgi:hypothetical protein